MRKERFFSFSESATCYQTKVKWINLFVFTPYQACVDNLKLTGIFRIRRIINHFFQTEYRNNISIF